MKIEEDDFKLAAISRAREDKGPRAAWHAISAGIDIEMAARL